MRWYSMPLSLSTLASSLREVEHECAAREDQAVTVVERVEEEASFVGGPVIHDPVANGALEIELEQRHQLARLETRGPDGRSGRACGSK